ncbi:MAG: LysR family transcriptional regulator [Sphaerochaetaceae bacterium]|nr:LysR family transcriptional regulator [Sphaerochaetaceae bacterium]MDC7249580.1 LysR family transcriptional regulator [Sphaerochaetaceae bacterium]
MDKSTQYILEVAKCGGITKAAKNLYITPSALSKFILAKEKDLNVTLFAREGKKFVLTYAGERYVEMLEKLNNYQNEIDNEMLRLASMYMGRLRIGFQMSLATIVINNVLPEFQKVFPSMQIMLEEGSSNELFQLLNTRQLDVVLSLSKDNNPNFSYFNIKEGNILLVLPKNDPLLAKAIKKEGFPYPWIDITNCREQRCVLLSQGQFFRQITDQVYKKCDMVLNQNVQVKRTKSALLCVSNNMGITINCDLFVKFHKFEDKVDLLSFGEEQLKNNLSLVYQNNTMLLKEITALSDICKKYFN